MEIDALSLAIGLGLGIFISAVVYAFVRLDKDENDRS
jgi:hypothetical protein